MHLPSPQACYDHRSPLSNSRVWDLIPTPNNGGGEKHKAWVNSIVAYDIMFSCWLWEVPAMTSLNRKWDH